MDKDKQEKIYQGSSHGIAWAAFALAALALFLSVVAFNRAGTDVETIAAQTAKEVRQETQQALVRAEVITHLTLLQAQIAAAEAGEEISQSVVQTREILQESYTEASQEVRQEMQELDRELEQVEMEVRNDTAQGLETLGSLIASMRQDVLTDEK